MSGRSVGGGKGPEYSIVIFVLQRLCFADASVYEGVAVEVVLRDAEETLRIKSMPARLMNAELPG
jgi:hypothetical protein